ncbi:MAG: hypothetical protein ACOX3R_14150 [Desulfitobacteriia bacterium]|jgi:fibronectin type 3 domain-containing protein
MKKPNLITMTVVLCFLVLAAFIPSNASALAPSAPSGLTATCVQCGQIDLSWNPCSDTCLYYVFRSNSHDGSYSLLSATKTPGYRDTNLCPTNLTYFYKVVAIGNNYRFSPSSLPAAALNI